MNSWRCCWTNRSSNPGELLGKIAEEMGLITDEQLAQALAEQMGMQVVTLGDVEDAAGSDRDGHRDRWPSCIASSRSSSRTTC